MPPKRIYIFGDNDILAYDRNQVYDPQEDSWSMGASMPTARGRLGVAVVDDILYAMGGTGSTYLEPPVAVNEKYTPFGYGTVPPRVHIISPESLRTYASDSVSLAYTINKPVDSLSYSIDKQEPVPLTGNTTLRNLTIGEHTIIIYATDKFGNNGTSQPVTFTITETQPKPAINYDSRNASRNRS